MARKPKRTTTVTEELEEEGGEGDPGAASPETEDALSSSREDRAPRQPHVRVNRVDPEDGKPKFLAVVQPALANADYLKKRWGGGTYICETYGQRRNGRFGYITGTRETIDIDPSIPFKGANSARVNGDGAPEVVGREPTTMDTLLQGQMISMFREQNESRNSGMTLLVTMMQQGQQQSQQMMQLMMTLVTSLIARPQDSGTKDILTALVNANVNKPDDLDKFAKLMTVLKAGEGPKSSMSEVVGLVREVMDLRSELGGEPEDKDDMISLVKQLGPEALALLRTVAEREGIAPPRRADLGNPVPQIPATTGTVSAPPPNVPPVNPNNADEWAPFEGAMMQLFDFAQHGAEPHHAVGTALMIATPEQKAMLREKVNDPDLAAKLIARFPAWQNQSAWLTQFVEELYVEFNPDAGDDDEPGDTATVEEPTT